MSAQTCLLPVENEDSSGQRPMANSYSFVSECFYLTHSVIHLGFVVAVERTIKINQVIIIIHYKMKRNEKPLNFMPVHSGIMIFREVMSTLPLTFLFIQIIQYRNIQGRIYNAWLPIPNLYPRMSSELNCRKMFYNLWFSTNQRLFIHDNVDINLGRRAAGSIRFQQPQNIADDK